MHKQNNFTVKNKSTKLCKNISNSLLSCSYKLGNFDFPRNSISKFGVAYSLGNKWFRFLSSVFKPTLRRFQIVLVGFWRFSEKVASLSKCWSRDQLVFIECLAAYVTEADGTALPKEKAHFKHVEHTL